MSYQLVPAIYLQAVTWINPPSLIRLVFIITLHRLPYFDLEFSS
jgi:hypothetical protein